MQCHATRERRCVLPRVLLTIHSASRVFLRAQLGLSGEVFPAIRKSIWVVGLNALRRDVCKHVASHLPGEGVKPACRKMDRISDEVVFPRCNVLKADVSVNNKVLAEAGDLIVLQDDTYGSARIEVANKVSGYAQ